MTGDLGNLVPIRLAIVLEPTAAAAGQARARLQRWLRGQSRDEQLAADAALVTSELVTNAVVHARSAVRLLAVLGDRLRLEVHDESGRPPAPRENTAGRPGGYGLRIVTAVAAEWGWDRTPSGKVVWSELELDPALRPGGGTVPGEPISRRACGPPCGRSAPSPSS